MQSFFRPRIQTMGFITIRTYGRLRGTGTCHQCKCNQVQFECDCANDDVCNSASLYKDKDALAQYPAEVITDATAIFVGFPAKIDPRPRILQMITSPPPQQPRQWTLSVNALL